MSNAVAKFVPESWHFHHVKGPTGSCLITVEDLQKLFDIFDEKQNEVANTIEPLLGQGPNESDEQFGQRQTKVRNAFVTLVSITAPDGTTVHGNSRELFSSPSVDRIQTVLFNTSNALKAIGITPPNEAALFLDFGKPPAINIGVLPSAPTPNGSNYEIQGKTEAWVTALDARLRQFFETRKTGRGWIHKQGIYEVFLFLVGLPTAIWASWRLSPVFYTDATPPVLVGAICVYWFFIGLYVFRIGFDYTRWVFPLVELEGQRVGTPARHRGVWYILVCGIIGAAAYDIIKSFVIQT